MKGLIIMNAYPNGEKFYRQSRRLAEELKRAGAETEIRLNGGIEATIRTDGAADCIGGFDFACISTRTNTSAECWSWRGFGCSTARTRWKSATIKCSPTLRLSGRGSAFPKRSAAPLCYTPAAVADGAFLARVGERLGFPLVAKKSFGSFGKDVRLLPDMEALKATAQEFLYAPHFYQRYIAASAAATSA